MKMRSLGRQAAPLPGSPRQQQQDLGIFLQNIPEVRNATSWECLLDLPIKFLVSPGRMLHVGQHFLVLWRRLVWGRTHKIPASAQHKSGQLSGSARFGKGVPVPRGDVPGDSNRAQSSSLPCLCPALLPLGTCPF